MVSLRLDGKTVWRTPNNAYLYNFEISKNYFWLKVKNKCRLLLWLNRSCSSLVRLNWLYYCWKWRFRPAFWVCSTQTLVKIYNTAEPFWTHFCAAKLFEPIFLPPHKKCGTWLAGIVMHCRSSFYPRLPPHSFLNQTFLIRIPSICRHNII